MVPLIRDTRAVSMYAAAAEQQNGYYGTTRAVGVRTGHQTVIIGVILLLLL